MLSRARVARPVSGGVPAEEQVLELLRQAHQLALLRVELLLHRRLLAGRLADSLLWVLRRPVLV